MRVKATVTMLVCMLLMGAVGFLGNRDVSQAANQTGVVIANSLLNVRTGPGTDNAKLQSDGVDVQLPNGTKVTIIESTNGWYKVSFVYNSKTLTGYVSAQYIGR